MQVREQAAEVHEKSVKKKADSNFSQKVYLSDDLIVSVAVNEDR